MKYNNHLNYKKRKRFLMKVRLFIFAVIIALLTTGVLAYLKYFNDSPTNNNTVSGQTVTTVSPSINIFRTQYYQFQTPDTWVEVTNESTATKKVYRGLRSNLIEHQMEIYIDQIPADLESTRALPVTMIDSRTAIAPGEATDHCVGKNVNKNSSIFSKDVEVGKTTIRCDLDGQTYTVLVGEIGKGTTLKMIRPDGTNVTFSIFYTNLTANPQASEFAEILKSFQTR